MSLGTILIRRWCAVLGVAGLAAAWAPPPRPFRGVMWARPICRGHVICRRPAAWRNLWPLFASPAEPSRQRADSAAASKAPVAERTAAAAAAAGGEARAQALHVFSRVSGPAWKAVSVELGCCDEDAKGLVAFGGVYHMSREDWQAAFQPQEEVGDTGGKVGRGTGRRRGRATPSRRARRLRWQATPLAGRTEDARAEGPSVEFGDYLRLHPEPKRYPACQGVDWEERIVLETVDLMVVDKPQGVPCHATVDNLHENLLECIRPLRDGGDWQPYLPHRLDTDTSGLVIVAKNKQVVSALGDAVGRCGRDLSGPGTVRGRKKHKSERGEGPGGGGGGEATCRKVYRAVVEVLPGAQPLRLGPLDHYMKVSQRAPRTFSRLPPQGKGGMQASGEDKVVRGGEAEGDNGQWLECRLVVLSAGDLRRPGAASSTSASTSSSSSSSSLSLSSTVSSNPWQEEEEVGVVRAPSSASTSSSTSSSSSCFSSSSWWEEKGVVPVYQEVEVELLTGRTHQIRGQLSAEGSPIKGDNLYGPAARARWTALADTAPPPDCALGGWATADAVAAAPAAAATTTDAVAALESRPELDSESEPEGLPRPGTWSPGPGEPESRADLGSRPDSDSDPEPEGQWGVGVMSASFLHEDKQASGKEEVSLLARVQGPTPGSPPLHSLAVHTEEKIEKNKSGIGRERITVEEVSLVPQSGSSVGGYVDSPGLALQACSLWLELRLEGRPAEEHECHVVRKLSMSAEASV